MLMIELYVEFEQHSGLDAVGEEVNVDEFGDIDWEEDNNDNKQEFEANYEVDDENDDGDLAGNPTVQNEVDAILSRYLFGVPSFMRTLDLEAMHVPKFFEYVNMSYSRTEQEYNKNYQRLKERDEAYTQWCDEIGVQRWVLAFDGGSLLGIYDDKLGRVHKFSPKGAHNLLVTAIARSTFYRLMNCLLGRALRLMSVKKNTVAQVESQHGRVDRKE
ncbi:hypothetical protein Ahy_A10g048877 [Arachis hypogaea]|uniref:Uncharacterized protein n=1 Tax=Arachis hypogaea TaxID=3818 RepID=A0A445B639_ARAHY|nr:hypothetical protein Ahy_A10g048877 [Arachis hypogaea]